LNLDIFYVQNKLIDLEQLFRMQIWTERSESKSASEIWPRLSSPKESIRADFNGNQFTCEPKLEYYMVSLSLKELSALAE
jgi:hypothetical protein